ncbi:hypothetical protein J0X19_04030 [Hymenobacter sp. BT186]|uniref:Uncharacterized protein n=1 Tax=Hymenobacter telluris TaxID=2816474 RepID=A0A939ET91_9BACT|nr:hypothetical protein [Hymenobacter telluris]MBO0357105.1 hypothetical protein [Hymenobacter telluris]MBW3373132.1 hypothetical protein [Hymenobacter norwichensis]
MANLVTFEAYLRYVRRQSSPTEAYAVRAWLTQLTHAGLAISWMQQYAQLLAQEADPTGLLVDLDAMQGKLLAQLKLAPTPVTLRRKASRVARLVHFFYSCFHCQEFLGLRAFFHRLHWQ